MDEKNTREEIDNAYLEYANEPEPSTSEIYSVIDQDTNVFTTEIDGKTVTIVGEEYGNPLPMIEAFVEGAARGHKGFVLEKSITGKKTFRSLKLGKFFTSISHFLATYSPDKIPSPNVELFYDVCSASQWNAMYLDRNPNTYYPEFGKHGAEIFNDLIQDIATRSRTRAFKRKIYAREYNAVRNFQSAAEYIRTLFEWYSKLLVIRIDFGFRTDCPEQKHPVTLSEAQKYLDRFLNNRRTNKLFAHEKGYIWKLESGHQKGYHFHLFFFFDGERVRKDEYICKRIGDFWKEITDGRGIYHNCNLSKQKYRRCGIGMVTHSDSAKRANLLYALKYLFKKEQYLREKFTKKTRTFGRGEMSGERTSKVGRPRKTGGDQSAE